MVFLFGLGLWFAIAGETLTHGSISILPKYAAFGWNSLLTCAAGFYIIALLFNKAKAGAFKMNWQLFGLALIPFIGVALGKLVTFLINMAEQNKEES